MPLPRVYLVKLICFNNTLFYDDCSPKLSSPWKIILINSGWQDLFYCYAHMTPSDLRTLDTIGGPDYMEGYISDDGEPHVNFAFSLER